MDLTRSHQIEARLNRLNVNDKISLGEFIGNYLYLEMRRKDIFRQCIGAMRLWLMPKGYIRKIYPVGNSHENIDPTCIALVSVIKMDQRFTSFFEGIFSTPGLPVFLTSGLGSREGDSYQSFNVPPKRLPFSLAFKVMRLTGISPWEKLLCLGGLNLQWMFFEAWKIELPKLGSKIILCDSDRYSLNVPLVLAARMLSIPTISLVHGATTPSYSYMPVIADHLFVWGKKQLEQFSKMNPTHPTIHVTGNPKIRGPIGIQNKNIKNKKSIRTLGLATTKLPGDLRDRLMATFLEGGRGLSKLVVKIHPNEDRRGYAGHSGQSASNEISFLPRDSDPSEFLESLDALCVRNSQMGSDALNMNIPIIVLDCGENWNLQNGKTLNSEAGCPIIQNSTELKQELQRLNDDWNYHASRLKNQKVYFEQLYAYTDEESTNAMLEEIQMILSAQES